MLTVINAINTAMKAPARNTHHEKGNPISKILQPLVHGPPGDRGNAITLAMTTVLMKSVESIAKICFMLAPSTFPDAYFFDLLFSSKSGKA